MSVVDKQDTAVKRAAFRDKVARQGDVQGLTAYDAAIAFEPAKIIYFSLIGVECQDGCGDEVIAAVGKG